MMDHPTCCVSIFDCFMMSDFRYIFQDFIFETIFFHLVHLITFYIM